MERILFICTGNYYRSRFAEALFNFQASQRGLHSKAFSRGLATYMVDGWGPLSPHTRAALGTRGIDLEHTGPEPVQLSEDDLESATRIIALRDFEHRPMIQQQFPEWESRIEFWSIADLDVSPPDVAIKGIDALIANLVGEVADKEARREESV